MARQLIQRCRDCGAHSLRRICPECGGPAQASAPMKWSPEDPQAHRRRKLHDVSSEAWSKDLPCYEEE